MLGTVEGDIHDAGKDLYQMMLTVHGFSVYDLGVDVPPADVLAKALELKPDIIGLSCLMVGAYPAMKETIRILHANPELKDTPVIIGGQVNQEVSDFMKADHWSKDAMDGVRWCQEWIGLHKPNRV